MKTKHGVQKLSENKLSKFHFLPAVPSLYASGNINELFASHRKNITHALKDTQGR